VEAGAVDQRSRAQPVDAVALIEARALADQAEELAWWGEEALAVELIIEAIRTLAAAGVELPATGESLLATEPPPAGGDPTTGEPPPEIGEAPRGAQPEAGPNDGDAPKTLPAGS
jgi:hypothetical protein